MSCVSLNLFVRVAKAGAKWLDEFKDKLFSKELLKKLEATGGNATQNLPPEEFTQFTENLAGNIYGDPVECKGKITISNVDWRLRKVEFDAAFVLKCVAYEGTEEEVVYLYVQDVAEERLVLRRCDKNFIANADDITSLTIRARRCRNKGCIWDSGAAICSTR